MKHEHLIERLRDRACSYRQGGPSSEHTAALLDEAAVALEALPLTAGEEPWPPLKMAIWRVVTGERLNARYVNAHDLTDKLFAAVLASLPTPIEREDGR
jgi:hypothetical protein